MGRRSYEDLVKSLKKDPERYRQMLEQIRRQLLTKQPQPMKCYIDYTKPKYRPKRKPKQKPKRIPRVVVWRQIARSYGALREPMERP
jgi:hypothetical protein